MSNSEGFVIENGVLIKYTGKETDVVIPDGVTEIGAMAFRDSDTLAAVTIPDSVTSIGDEAFSGCCLLKAITIPDGVKSIGKFAFWTCFHLESVTFSGSVASIGKMAFRDCDRLEAVYIGNLAAWCGISFGNAESNPLCYAHTLYINGIPAENMVIPDGVTGICARAFCYCDSITSVTIPESVKSIGEEAFWECTSLKTVTLTDGVSADAGAFNAPVYFKGRTAESLSGWLEPENIVSGFIMNYKEEGAAADVIQSYADYLELHKYELGFAFLTENKGIFDFALEHRVFTGEDVDIIHGLLSDNRNEKAAAELAEYAHINNIENEITDKVIDEGYVPLAGIVKEWKFRYEPDGTATLTEYTGDKAEVSCPVKIGDKPVTCIGEYAFYSCSVLTAVTIHAGIKSIGEWAFAFCRNLEAVIISDGTESIGDEAFRNCSSLKSITIPDSVKSMGESVFFCCDALPDEIKKKSRNSETVERVCEIPGNLPVLSKFHLIF